MRVKEERGYTLVELVIVVAILGLVAAVAVPNITTGSDKKLSLAAEEVASAIRFARSEALRTGEGHGLTVSQATQKVTVTKYDITIVPISTLGTLTHPIDKQPYDFNVNTSTDTKGVTISNSSDVFDYGPEGRRRSLIFDPRGVPIWIVGSDPTRHLLEDGTIELSYGTQQRIVSVAPITGRVTVQ
jgi:prepilin-type N-terminal cleavage/methylation domain-containing protein